MVCGDSGGGNSVDVGWGDDTGSDDSDGNGNGDSGDGDSGNNDSNSNCGSGNSNDGEKNNNQLCKSCILKSGNDGAGRGNSACGDGFDVGSSDVNGSHNSNGDCDGDGDSGNYNSNSNSGGGDSHSGGKNNNHRSCNAATVIGKCFGMRQCVVGCGGVAQCAARSGMATATCGSSPLVVVVVSRWRGQRRRAAATELYGARGQGGQILCSFVR